MDRQGNMSGNGEAGELWCDMSEGLHSWVLPPELKTDINTKGPIG